MITALLCACMRAPVAACRAEHSTCMPQRVVRNGGGGARWRTKAVAIGTAIAGMAIHQRILSRLGPQMMRKDA